MNIKKPKNMLPDNFIPSLPFAGFKWKWASVACTEGLNDPLYLLGILYRLYKIEDGKRTYSSPEFATEMKALEKEIQGKTAHDVNISSRIGERNLMRNSKQYWTSTGLIVNNHKGIIQLTDFGREIAKHNITQTEFAAITVQTFCLPNHVTMQKEEFDAWEHIGLKIKPLKLILSIIRALYLSDSNQGYLTNDELTTIVIPLSGTIDASIDDYTYFILKYRANPASFTDWPNCCPMGNDRRIAREFLLFLEYYGFITEDKREGDTNLTSPFLYNSSMDTEIELLLNEKEEKANLMETWEDLKSKSSVLTDLERKRIRFAAKRPNQTAFRKQIMATYGHCIVTDVEMPEVLEAAHIVPFAYRGEDTIANGFPLRSDIHILFDSGHLRIHPSGEIFLSDRARANYGFTIRRHIDIPPQINKEFLQWRWDNYSGI